MTQRDGMGREVGRVFRIGGEMLAQQTLSQELAGLRSQLLGPLHWSGVPLPSLFYMAGIIK